MGDMINLKVDLSELNKYIDKFPDKIDKSIEIGTREYAIKLYNLTQELCPADTGQLRMSGDLDIYKMGFRITYGGVKAPYAAAVHFGYKRHFIAPKYKKALAWVKEGQGDCTKNKSKRGLCYFSKGHYVPKNKNKSKPNPFIYNAIFKLEGEWEKEILKAFEKLKEA